MRSLNLGTNRSHSDKTTAGKVAVLLAFTNCGLAAGFLFLSIAYFGLLGKEPPAMVQLESGRSIAMESIDTYERAPAVQQSFVRDTLTLLYSASGKLPTTGGKPAAADPGVKVATSKGEMRISTVSSLAGWGLTSKDNFRSEFLRNLAEVTPQEVFNGNAEVALSIRHISEPVAGKDGRSSKLIVLSEQIVRSSDNPIGVAVPKNMIVHLRAITPPVVKTYSSDLERQIASVRQASLVIEKIEPYINENEVEPVEVPAQMPASASTPSPSAEPYPDASSTDPITEESDSEQ
jgi:hypothetical protein